MEKIRYELFDQILKRFDEHNLLDNLIVIGSWCIYLYGFYFNDPNYSSGIRTRDVDFLVTDPDSIPETVSAKDLIADMGFVEDLKGEAGYTQFLHPELMIEFLIHNTGTRKSKIYIPQLKVNVQPLRYLELLSSHVITVNYEDLDVRVPAPANFALHKILISVRRKDKNKAELDIKQGIEMLNYLIDKGEISSVKSVFTDLHKGWQKDIEKVLSKYREFMAGRDLFE